MAYTLISSISRYISDTVAELPTTLVNAGSTAFVANKLNYTFNGTSWGLAPMPIVPFNSSGTEIVPATSALQTAGNSTLTNISAAVTGSLISTLTSQAITANTDILATAFTATKTGTSVLMISVAAAGILSLKVNGVLSKLFDGDALETGKWYECEIVIIDDSVYNIQYSVSDTIQLQWVVR